MRAVDAECRSVKVVIGMVERALETEEATSAATVPDNVIVGCGSLATPATFARRAGDPVTVV